MTATTLFYIIIAIICVNFIIDKILEALNAKHYNDAIPEELHDRIFDRFFRGEDNESQGNDESEVHANREMDASHNDDAKRHDQSTSRSGN